MHIWLPSHKLPKKISTLTLSSKTGCMSFNPISKQWFESGITSLNAPNICSIQPTIYSTIRHPQFTLRLNYTYLWTNKYVLSIFAISHTHKSVHRYDSYEFPCWVLIFSSKFVYCRASINTASPQEINQHTIYY